MLHSFKNVFNAISKAHAHIPYPLLFTEQFMQAYTDFENWEALMEFVDMRFPNEEKLEQLFQEQPSLRALHSFWKLVRDEAKS